MTPAELVANASKLAKNLISETDENLSLDELVMLVQMTRRMIHNVHPRDNLDLLNLAMQADAYLDAVLRPNMIPKA